MLTGVRALSFRFLLSDDRSIYAVSFSGALLWYQDLLRNGGNGANGERGWAPNSGNQIGFGWSGFEHVVAGGDGIIYAIKETGELIWYKDLLRDGSNGARGESGWAPNNGQQINVGWNGFKHVFSGGGGVIYAIKQTGELLWFQDQARDGSNGANAERGWASNGGSQIGVGWDAFEQVFCGDNGIIYAIGNAELRWYQDLLRDGTNGPNGDSGWAAQGGQNAIGNAWGGMQHVVSPGGGVIYGIAGNDLFFSLDARQDGSQGPLVDPGNRIGIERQVTIGAPAFLMLRGADDVFLGLDWWGFRLESGPAPSAIPCIVARSDERP